MDAATLSRAMGGICSPARYAELLPGFNAAMIQAECTTRLRAAMWCAQLGQESVGLSAMREYASGAEYEDRADLGNTQPGDGVRFAGRGPIQVTGRGNYTKLSRWAHGKGYVPTPTYFVDNPVALEQPRYGFLGAVWYWTVARPDINELCDEGDLDTVTRRINGGTNGIKQRRINYNRCLGLGDAILPTESDFLMALDKAQQDTVLGAAIQTGAPQVTDAKLKTLGPRTQRHGGRYNVDGGAGPTRKLAYLRAMVMDLWNDLVFDGYPAAADVAGDPGLDEGKFGSPVGFIIATHANSRRSLRLQKAIARKVGLTDAEIAAAVGPEDVKA